VCTVFTAESHLQPTDNILGNGEQVEPMPSSSSSSSQNYGQQQQQPSPVPSTSSASSSRTVVDSEAASSDQVCICPWSPFNVEYAN